MDNLGSLSVVVRLKNEMLMSTSFNEVPVNFTIDELSRTVDTSVQATGRGADTHVTLALDLVKF